MTRRGGWLRAAVWGLGLGLVAAVGGCGGGSSSGDGQVRLINATRTHPTLDLLSSSSRVLSSVARHSASSYVGVAAGSASLSVVDAGQSTALVSTGPTVTKDASYALVAYESAGVVKTVWLAENDTVPSSGASTLRVVNMATDAGALDVYVTASGTALSAATPSFSLASSTSVQSTSLLSFSPGTYRVRVTAAGDASDLRLDIPAVTLTDKQVQNLLLMPTSGGGLIDGAWLTQKGSYAATENTGARLRLVSGVPSSVVAASTATTVLEAGAVSPMIGGYLTVPSGQASWTVTVGGAAVALSPLTLSAGADYTLLVTGSAAAAQAVLLPDDNHLPTLSGTDHMRLVNGLSGPNAALSLTVDFALLASNVAPGSASAYKVISANSSLRLQVDSPASVTPVSLQTGLNVPSGGVYSVFVLGDAATPVTVLRRDR